MKNVVRKLTTLILVLALSLSTTISSALAGDEPMGWEKINLQEFLDWYTPGWTFLYEGLAMDGTRCTVWQRDYGPAGRLWIPEERDSYYEMMSLVTRNRTFFFPWEGESEVLFWNLETLSEEFGVDLTVKVNKGVLSVKYQDSWFFPEPQDETEGFVMDDYQAVYITPEGNVLINSRFVTEMVTHGKF